MINLKKLKLDVILLIVMLALMAGYHFLRYFGCPWESYGDSIRQLANNTLIVIGCSFFAFFAMFILIVLLLITKKFPNKITIPILIMLIFGVFWVGYSILFDNISPTLLLRDSFPPFSLITCGVILAGYNHKWWKLLKNIIFIVACLFVLYAFVEIIIAFSKFGFNYRMTSGAPMYLYIIGLYATYGLVTLTDEWRKNRKAIVFILVILLFFNSAILQGRSWFIQTIILFVIYVFRIRAVFRKNAIFRISITFISIAIAITIFATNIDLFQGLIERFQTSGDTRTAQLKAFFSQVGFNDLMIGGGIRAGYLFNNDPNFHFVDNQVLLYMFRYGIIPTVTYLYLLLYPVYKSFRLKNKKLILKSIVLISWFAAMLGLSVYFNLTFGMAHMLIMIYTGRLFYEVLYYKANRKLAEQ